MAAINPRDKQRQRALDDALQLRLSARFDNRLRIEIARTMREAAAEYEKRGELAIPMAIADHSAGIRNTLTANHKLVAAHFGKRLLSEVKGHHGPSVIKASAEQMLEMAIDQFILQWIATKVTQINRTTEEQIRSVIRTGLEEGLSVDAIARRLRELAAPLSALRSHVIARTETHQAANFGAQQAAELTELEMRREWVATMDSRTRSPHASADGQTVGMNQPFRVNGESLMYPGDPAGSAGNTIMCRCSVAFIYD